MRCPFCSNSETKVLDSRESEDKNRRRRECLKCGGRFTTYEHIELKELRVVKKSGNRESFNPDKLKRGIMHACEKRPVSEEQINRIVEEVEGELRKKHESTHEVSSREIGDAIMKRLKKIDEVTYIRFASVYMQFKDITSFENELKALKHEKR